MQTGTLNIRSMYYTGNANTGNKFLGIEHIYGNYYKLVDGFCSLVTGELAYKPHGPYGNVEEYIKTGLVRQATGFVKDMTYGPYGKIATNTVGGSATTFYTDEWYFLTNSNQGNCAVGGTANMPNSSGLFCTNLMSTSGTTYLVYVPQ